MTATQLNESIKERQARLLAELEQIEQDHKEDSDATDALNKAMDEAQAAILAATKSGKAADLKRAREQMREVSQMTKKAEQDEAMSGDMVSRLKVHMEKEIERVKARTERQIRAARNGVTPDNQMGYEKSQEAIERLQAKGMLYPEYERGSGKVVVRLPMPWKIALLQEAERRGCNQSELMREGLKKVLDPQVAADLEDVYNGKRLS